MNIKMFVKEFFRPLCNQRGIINVNPLGGRKRSLSEIQSGGGGTSTSGLPISGESITTSQFPADLSSIIQGLQRQIGGLTTGQATQENLQSFLTNPLSSDLFQGTIGPLLQSLQPSEAASRRALADQFRIAGGGQGGALQSGAFAQAARQNEADILNKRSELVANRANETFRNILSSLGLGLQAEKAQTEPARLGLGLLGAIPRTGTTQQTFSRTLSPSGGGAGLRPIRDAGDLFPGESALRERLRQEAARTGGSRVGGVATSDPFSSSNPGRTPAEKEFFSTFGVLPPDPADPFADVPLSGGGDNGFGVTRDPNTGTFVSDPFGGGFSGFSPIIDRIGPDPDQDFDEGF